MMEWRLVPYVTHAEWANQPHVFVFAAAMILCGLLAGRSIMTFVRRFLPSALALFIILPCLVLFDAEKHDGFILFMSTLVAIFSNIIWVVFSAALIELYAGKFWHYGLAAAIYFINIFLYIGPPLGRMIPDGTEYMVFTMGIATLALLLLSYRIFVPKEQPMPDAPPEPAANRLPIVNDLEEIFRDFGLSGREIEIANILAREGLPNKEISVRLDISVNTTNKHIARIFRKFGVKKRSEFLALLLTGYGELDRKP
jgi:DNA-binding CsgD family transcriptional regulator